MELIQILLLVFTIFTIYILFFRRKRGNFPPGPTPWPIVGNILQMSRNFQTYETFTKWSEKYGPIFSVQLGGTSSIVLNDPQVIRDAFNHPHLNGRPDNKVFLAPGGGYYGVLGVAGQGWADQRRFTLKHLRDFGFGKKNMEFLIVDEAKELIESFKNDEGKPINPARRFNLAVLNSLWIIVTGTRINHDDPLINYILEEYFKQLGQVFVAGVIGFIPKLADIAPEKSGWNAYIRAIKKATGFFKRVVDEHVKDLDENEPKDYIDAYLKEIKKTSDPNSSFFKDNGYKNLLAIVGDLFAAGGETTSTTLNWSVLFLASFPEVQKKLQEEIDTVVGNRYPSLEDKSQMPYTEALMQEIHRKASIAGIGLFHKAVEDVKFHGFDIPKGTWIIPNFHRCHHNPSIWGDPENFRPERFLSSDGKTILKNEALMPFSIGKRICLGETLARDEFFLFLTTLFQRFDIQLDPSQSKASLIPALGSFIITPQAYSIIARDRYGS